MDLHSEQFFGGQKCTLFEDLLYTKSILYSSTMLCGSEPENLEKKLDMVWWGGTVFPFQPLSCDNLFECEDIY